LLSTRPPVICRAGPRLFIGKLTKETTEQDVKEYFTQFGYVMDVYMPKAKDNKAVSEGLSQPEQSARACKLSSARPILLLLFCG
jgi:RNA recognition motif-containing protein